MVRLRARQGHSKRNLNHRYEQTVMITPGTKLGRYEVRAKIGEAERRPFSKATRDNKSSLKPHSK